MTIATADLDYLRAMVADRSGNVISATQGYLFEQKLTPLLQETGLASLDDLMRAVRSKQKPMLCDQIVEAMTINETSFFRDMHPFDSLRDTLAPDIIEKREKAKSISILCGACSSGQEPYSVAITLREHFPQLADWRIQITATDICDKMLARTKEGRYSQFEVNRGLPARLLVKHFDRQGTEWCVKPALKQMIHCQKINLTKSWPRLPEFDIVFLRNVLIYFDRNAKEEILKRVFGVLRSDGYLLLGGGETLINLSTPFVQYPINKTVCYRPKT